MTASLNERVYDALMAAGKRALADEYAEANMGSPLIAAVADALDDRDAHEAARLVRDTDPDDDLWNNYVGPMLDELEDDYTTLAREMREEQQAQYDNEWGDPLTMPSYGE